MQSFLVVLPRDNEKPNFTAPKHWNKIRLEITRCDEVLTRFGVILGKQLKTPYKPRHSCVD